VPLNDCDCKPHLTRLRVLHCDQSVLLGFFTFFCSSITLLLFPTSLATSFIAFSSSSATSPAPERRPSKDEGRFSYCWTLIPGASGPGGCVVLAFHNVMYPLNLLRHSQDHQAKKLRVLLHNILRNSTTARRGHTPAAHGQSSSSPSLPSLACSPQHKLTPRQRGLKAKRETSHTTTNRPIQQ
ncbi:hypothetical protein TcCL_Unassigned02519, partial [Trypanosoma cruzi]